MYSSISSHVNMAQNYYNDIQAQYQAIQARNGAHTAPVNTVAGAVEYHRQNQNYETDAKIKTIFTGSRDDYVTLPAPIALGSSFTQEMWIRPTFSDKHTCAVLTSEGRSDGSDAHHRTACIYVDGRKVYFGFGDGSRWNHFTTPEVISLNAWNHIAIVYDSTTYKIYIDGSQKLDASLPGKVAKSPIKYIGKALGCSENFQGQIDDMRIWDVARTADQIKDNMFKSMPVAEGNLKFSHCSKKVAALTDHDLQTSSPSALAAKATAIHNLVMRMNDAPAATDQRGNIEQLQSYVGQLSRIHKAFVHTKEKLQLSFELQQKQVEVTTKNAQLAEKSNQIQALTAQSTDLTNQLQDKISQIATLQMQQQIQTTNATALGPQIELIRSVFQEQGADLRRQLTEKDTQVAEKNQRIAYLEAQLLQASSQNSFMLQHVLQMQLTNQTNQPNLSMQTLVQLSSAPSLPPVFTSMGALSIGSNLNVPQIAAQGHSNNTNTHNN